MAKGMRLSLTAEEKQILLDVLHGRVTLQREQEEVQFSHSREFSDQQFQPSLELSAMQRILRKLCRW